MDIISIDLVYKFALDLKKIIDILGKEFGRDLYKNSMNTKLIKRANLLTKNLYTKYKNVFDLDLIEEKEEINLAFKNTYNDSIFIPKHFFESKSFIEVNENFKVIILTMKRAQFSWEEFTFQLTHLFVFNTPKEKFLTSNNLEKIRFFMTFINKFPNYINETPIPNMAKKYSYRPIYSRWGRKTSFYITYLKHIQNNPSFFKNHVRTNPIPNYNYWNLNMIFLDSEELTSEITPSCLPGYPLQIFENIDGSLNSSMFLLDKTFLKTNKRIYKDLIVTKFSIINNFNHFKQNITKNKSQRLEIGTFFENYANYIDDLHTMDENFLFNHTNYEFIIDFTKDEEHNDSIDLIMNKQTIKMFNLLYNANSNFQNYYSSTSYKDSNPYRVLFKNRYTFPDFNIRNNFILRIRKKKNSYFTKSVSFFKYWSYQCQIYETKEKIIFYGFLPPNFKYNEEIIYIKELLDSLNTEFKFLITNKDVKQSTLSLYSLPNSKQFLEKEKMWNLNKLNKNLRIKEKEDIIIDQIDDERKN